MIRLLSAFLGIGGLLALLFIPSCRQVPKGCSLSTCAGCCSESGECLTGDADQACGAGGYACVTCSAGFPCGLGWCGTPPQTGGGSGGGGSGDGTDAGPLPSGCVLSWVEQPVVPSGLVPEGAVLGQMKSGGGLEAVIATSTSGSVYVASLGLDGGVSVPYPAGTAAAAVRVLDLDGNGNLDALIALSGANGVRVLQGDGLGTLASGLLYPTGSVPSALTIGDLTQDGRMDGIVVHQGDGTVRVLIGATGGGFDLGPPVTAGAGAVSVAFLPIGPTAGPTGPTAGPAVAWVNQGAGGRVAVSTRAADGGLSTPTTLASFSEGDEIVAANFNADSRTDLAVSRPSLSLVTLFLSGSGGTLVPSASLQTAAGPSSLAVADVNRDGRNDLLVSASAAGVVHIFLGTGTGTFQSPITLDPAGAPGPLAAGDVTGDGIPDIVVTQTDTGGIAWYAGTCGP